MAYRLNNGQTPLAVWVFGECSIADLGIFSRELSSNEVAALYAYESDPCAQWIDYLTTSLPTNLFFFSALAANTNFVGALASSITAVSDNYGISRVGLQGPQGPVGVFDPTVLTNGAFLTGLASNPVFLNALTAQILTGSNNYGVAVKQDQSLNFPAVPMLTITPGRKYTNNVTTSSGLPVTQTSGNTAVATVSNNVLTLIGSGSTTITATQAGNALWNPVSASQPLIVTKGTQALTFTAIKPMTFTPYATVTLSCTSSAKLTNTTYSIDNGAVGSISNNVLLILGRGTATITATNSGNAYFALAFATRTLIVQ